jgi:hypothetical protein
MTYHSRSLTDWLLLRAWIEPDHDQKLRVVVRSQGGERGDQRMEQAFADADGAAAFVRSWLRQLLRRWEAGERFPPADADQAAEPDEVGEEDYAARDERN